MATEKKTYFNIDMEATGEKLRSTIYTSGYSVKDVQNYLQLSCPQPIYRWFKGQVLPTVDHFYMLSKLLGVHMEDLIVPKKKVLWKLEEANEKFLQRIYIYCKHLAAHLIDKTVN